MPRGLETSDGMSAMPETSQLWLPFRWAQDFADVRSMIDRDITRNLLRLRLDLPARAWLWDDHLKWRAKLLALTVFLGPFATTVVVDAYWHTTRGDVLVSDTWWIFAVVFVSLAGSFLIAPILRHHARAARSTHPVTDFIHDGAGLTSIPIEWVRECRMAVGKVYGVSGDRIRAEDGPFSLWLLSPYTEPLKGELVAELLASLDAEVYYDDVMERFTDPQRPWPCDVAGIISRLYAALGVLTDRPVPPSPIDDADNARIMPL